MMELNHITAGYGEEDILKDISLAFPTGQVTVLVGPNGCGKSTLLRVAAQLMPQHSGEILLRGENAALLSRKELARQVALLPQSRPVAGITVGALVLHGRFPYLGYPRKYTAADHAAANLAMAQCDVAHLAQRQVSKLSGGQRQKVYLAMAMAQDTPFLLLDEPTTFLDIAHQLELAQQARDLAQAGKGVVMVLHDLNMALTCADRVAVMEHGQLRGTGTPKDVFDSGVLEQVFRVHAHRTVLNGGQTQYFFTAL